MAKIMGKQEPKKIIKKVAFTLKAMPFPAILNFHFDSFMVAGVAVGVMTVKTRASTRQEI